MAMVKTQLVIEGKNNSKRAFEEVSQQIDSIDKKLSAVGKTLATAFSVSQLAGAIRAIAASADNINLMTARLRLATESQEEFNAAQTELRRIATATASPLSSLVTLYGRISRPLKEVGRSQRDILRITEAVATSFRISGASAQEAENGVIQFAQALGAGALRGDEFNSVAEQAPRLMQALADGIGVPVGALRELAAQGELTASVVTDALTSQLDALRKEAELLPDTVGGAMTRLADSWNETIGKADVQPLVDAINKLADTVSDPRVADNLVRLASAITKIGEAAINAAAGVVDFGDDLGYIAARVTGNVTEIDRARKELEKFEAAAKGFGMLDLYMSDERIERGVREWRAYLNALLREQTGMTKEMQKAAKLAEDAARQAAEAAKAQKDKELADYASYVLKLKELQTQMVKNAEKAGKDLVAAEKRLKDALPKVWEERLSIQQRYEQAIAELSGGGSGKASYGAAQSLRVAAMQAVARKDFEMAKKNAEAAMRMIQEMARAGENTYGFEGFLKELEAIELQANAIEEQAIKDKITGIEVSMAELAQQAKQLEQMPVSVKVDEASIAQVRSAIEQLAAQLGQQLVIPVSVAKPKADVETPGFASGGLIRGPGTGTSDSILARLSNGEFVMRAAAVKHYGPRLLELMNGLKLPKFAAGGLVEAGATLQTGPDRDLGRLVFELGGQETTVFASQHEALNLRRLAMKFGRTKRR